MDADWDIHALEAHIVLIILWESSVSNSGTTVMSLCSASDFKFESK